MPALPPSPLSLPDRFARRLSGKSGQALWRTLDELADTPGFRDAIGNEFPAGANEWPDRTSRRHFLQLAAASLSLAGLAGCKPRRRGTATPYVRQPEDVLPGLPSHYATAIAHRGYARGIVVTTNDGRPTKIEGNPDHPSSLGATDAVTQAAILDLYDPDRLAAPTRLGKPATWSSFEAAWQRVATSDPDGHGLHLVLAPTTSPSGRRQLDRLRKVFPEMTVHFHDPHPPVALPGPRPYDDFSLPDLILSLECDFLSNHPDALRHTRDFVSRRSPDRPNRLYVVESSPSVTGTMADHHLPLSPSKLDGFLRDLTSGSPSDPFARRLADDLGKHRGRTLVVTGPSLPDEIQVLAARLGSERRWLPAIQTEPSSPHSLAEALEVGKVTTLVFLGVNPIYDTPRISADLIATVPFTVSWSHHVDETTKASQWQLPATHFLEHWSDIRAWDGTTSIVQPLIEPLYQGRSIHHLLALLSHEADWDTPGPDRIQQTSRLDPPAWRKALRNGIVSGTALDPVAAPPRPSPGNAQPPSEGLDLVLRPDPYLGTGENANNPWLRELPRPLTTLTWRNAFLIAPSLATAHHLKGGDLIHLKIGETTVEGPVWVQPGHAPECVTAFLGYGRRAGGTIAPGLGFDATPLLGEAPRFIKSGARIEKTGAHVDLPATQRHQIMDGRPLVLAATYDEFRKHPDFAREASEPPDPDQTLYPPKEPAANEWGMWIDLNTCIGCNACVLACQAENNIPSVGPEQVRLGREMHWIRLDRYYAGDPGQPSFLHQPVPCMHCEHAPCEVVCPVAATSHSREGLNQMIYNRCIGTRYCSNNCPYKVRRFNFLDYHPDRARREPLALHFNPDVTVRSRGVMEKCTYCVQRINRAKQAASVERRDIRDGEIVTACQQACPAQAIRFGNLADPNSDVSRSKSSPRDYSLLASANTRPRTTYGARLTNPSPDAD